MVVPFATVAALGGRPDIGTRVNVKKSIKGRLEFVQRFSCWYSALARGVFEI